MNGPFVEKVLKLLNQEIKGGSKIPAQRFFEHLILLNNYIDEVIKQGIADISYWDEKAEIKYFVEHTITIELEIETKLRALRQEIARIEAQIKGYLSEIAQNKKNMLLSARNKARIDKAKRDITGLKTKVNNLAKQYQDIEKSYQEITGKLREMGI